MTKSTKSAYNVLKPASPKVEKEILSQLDELKSELSGWLQKIEQKKNVSPDKVSQNSRTRSTGNHMRVISKIKLDPDEKSSDEDLSQGYD